MSTDIRNTTTNYVHPTDPNLLNLHKAMQFDLEGKPVVRTLLNTTTVQITGPVNILSTVTVTSTPENPVHTHITEIGTSGILDVPYMPIQGTVTATQGTTPWIVTGTIALDTFTLTALENISVQNNVTATITGTVAVSNFPTTSTVYQGTDPWRITGTVDIGSLGEVEIKNDIGNPVPVSANTATNSNTNPIYVKGTSDTSFFSPAQSDAFGRLRVSNPFTLFDTFNRYQDNQTSVSSTALGGTSTYDANQAAVLLNVTTASGSSAYRETVRTFAYQPGKSLLVLQTFCFAPAKNNLTQRAGYFDTTNGFYLEQEGTNISFVRRSSVTGGVVETRISQTGGVYGAGDTGWNIDKLPSLDLSKSQILFLDIEWLGVGSVRMGFVIDGQFIICHQWHHANYITGPYTTTACLPVRKEIFNTGVTTSTSSMSIICISVISEGGYSLIGRARCIGHNLGSARSLANSPTTFTPLIAIRLKNTRPGAIVLPTTFTVTPVEQAIYKYRIYTRAVTTGGTWVSAGADSSVEYNLSPANITTGTVALEAFINATNQASGASETAALPFDYQLERDTFNNIFWEVVITMASSGNNSTAYSSLNWTEIT